MIRKEKSIMIILILGITFLAGVFTPTMYETGTTFLDSLSGDSIQTSTTERAQEITTSLFQTSTPETPMNTWIEGQSIKVTHEFGSRIPSPDQSYWRDNHIYTESEGRGIAYSFANMYIDDSNALFVSGGSDIESESFYDIYQIVFDLGIQAPRKGTIYMRGDSTVSQATLKSVNYPNIQIVKPSGVVSQWELDGDLESGDLEDYVQQDGKIYALLWIGWDSNAVAAYHYARAEINYFEVVFDDLIEYPRCEYKYSDSDTIQTKLSVWNPITSDLILNLPTDWELSSISPAVEYSIDGNNDLTITNALGNTEFTFFFTVNSLQYFLAIDDVSSDYLSDLSFEGSYTNDWIDYSGDSYDSLELNSTIVSKGAYSLRASHTSDDAGGIWSNFDLSAGEYYFSFWVYPEVWQAGRLIKWRYNNGSSDQVIEFELEEDRWNLLQGFFHKKGEVDSGAASLRIYDYGSPDSAITLFFDEIRFWQVNHEIETIDYSQTIFSGIMRNWDLYSNPVIPYHEVYMELRDRTEDSLIKQTSTITDSNGIFYWNFQGSLIRKEYEFRSWSYDNCFGDIIFKNTGDEADFNEEDREIFTTDYRTPVNIGYESGAIKWDSDDQSYEGIRGYPLAYPEIVYNILYRAKGNSGSINSDIIAYGGGSVVITDSGESLSTDYAIFDLRGSNQIDAEADLNDLSIRLAHQGYTIWIDWIKAVEESWYSQSYFTPITVSNSIYYYETNPNNEFDFSEGINEIDTDAWENGYIYDVSSSNYGGLNLNPVKVDFGTVGAYYTHAIIRIWVNVTGSYRFQINLENGTQNIITTTLTANNWHVWERSIESINTVDWELDSGTSVIQLIGNNLAGNKMVKLDYLRLVHKDSNLQSGYAWEFEEEDFTDGWIINDGGTNLQSLNGWLQVDCLNQWDGFKITDFEYQVSYDKVVFEARASTAFTGVMGFMDGSNAYYSDIPITTEWTIFEYSSCSFSPDNPTDYIYFSEANGETVTTTFYLRNFRFYYSAPSNLWETNSDFILENEGILDYILFSDSVFIGYAYTGAFIPKNLSVGSHEFVYSAYYNLFKTEAVIPSCFYYYEYTIEESDIMKIIIHDQSGNVKDFDSFKVYIDSVRLYDNYLFFTDISQIFNLTIADLFDNLLYQDTTEEFEQFKEIQITLYSVKLQNLQENPIWLEITRDAKTYSEWIFSYEIVEYHLETATYSFKIYYCDSLAVDLGALSTNGSWVNFNYAVSSDSALMVTGETIKDVFDNVFILTQDLTDVNASLSNQIVDVDIHISNINTSIANQIVTVDIFIENMNTTLGTQLISLESNIANVNTTIYTQTIQILSDLANMNSTIYSQTVSLLSNIANMNSTIYTQTLTIISDIANLDSDIIAQTTTLLSNISNMNSTIYTQTVSLLSNLSNMNSTIYSQTLSIISDIINMNSTIYTQTVSLLSNLSNMNSTIYSQTLSIISDIINMNSTIYSQTIQIISDISNVNSTLYAQNVNILSSLVNVNSTLHTQLITVLTDLAELQGIFTVHFDFIDGLGIGISWETFKLNVNDSRQYSQDLYVSNQTLLRLETLDYFNVSLNSVNYTINQSVDIAIISDIFELVFRNNNTEFTSIVNITRGGYILELQIPKDSTVSHRFTEGAYSIETFYLVEQEFENINFPDNFTLGIHELNSGSMTISSSLKVLGEYPESNIIDVGGPLPTKTLKGLIIDWLFVGTLLIQILAVTLSVTIAYLVRTRLIMPADKRIAFDWGKEKIQDPTVSTTSKIAHKIPGFKPEKRRKTKDKRRK